ncbi:MAG: hypothetical protein H6837_21175 [Planctomycetes bacterium]|nr:hypothetical protein [Planctomycetota bacterium]
MTQPATAESRPSNWLPWGVAALCGLVYLGLGQGALYGDGVGILLELHEHHALDSRAHFLYGPIVVGLWRMMEPWGVSLYRVALAASALGTAVGVGCLLQASRALFDGWRPAVWCAVLVATCPSVLFYATVVEHHGVFFAFAGLALLAMVRLAVRPGVGRAVSFGISTALAALTHATAHLLPWVGVALFPLLVRGDSPKLPLRRVLLLAAVVACTHLAVATGTLGLLRALGLASASVGFAAERLVQLVERDLPRLVHTPDKVLREWLWPFLPVSIGCLLALRRRSERRLAVVLQLLVLPYAMLTAVLVYDDEFGAYILPLAWPAAVLTVRTIHGRWLPLLLVAAALVGGVRLWRHETISCTRQAARALTAERGERDLFLLPVTTEDLELCFVGLPGVPFYYLPQLVRYPREAVQAFLPQLDPQLDQRIDAELAAGRTVVLTESGRLALRSASAATVSGAPRLVADHLEARYRTDPITAPGFSGWRLVARRGP